MLAKIIKSLQHPIVKHWTLLRTDRAYREDSQRLLLVGEKIIRELSKEVPLLSLATIHPSDDIKAQEKYLITEPIFQRMTGLDHPDGYAAEVAMPPQKDLSDKKFILILDQISDPGNLGTLLRTAMAFGWEGVILTDPGTVDLFNDKALRAAKGASFHLPYARMATEEIEAWIRKKNIHVFTADIEGKPLDELSFAPPLALILSSESQGPRPQFERISQKVTLPMSKQIESLNVASSGAILLYAMRPR